MKKFKEWFCNLNCIIQITVTQVLLCLCCVFVIFALFRNFYLSLLSIPFLVIFFILITWIMKKDDDKDEKQKVSKN